MDPRFNVYVTFIPDDADDAGSDGRTTRGGREAEPSREGALKKRADLPNKGGKARRRSGETGGNAGSDSK